jgi:hypothetical protein
MSKIIHHAIVITGDDMTIPDYPTLHGTALIQAAREYAIKLGCDVTPIISTQFNAYLSFMVCPDGGKEGWPSSIAGDTRRNKFKEWLAHNAMCVDGCSKLEWAEISYSRDDMNAEVVSHAFEDLV